MDVSDEIEAYLSGLAGPKQADLRRMHAWMLAEFPASRLWFEDGHDATGKVVSNPQIGYGEQTRTYADGTVRPLFRVGFSANTAGISVYVMGLDDKTYLARTYADTIGKASVTGYCIRFRHLDDTHIETLDAAIRDAMTRT